MEAMAASQSFGIRSGDVPPGAACVLTRRRCARMVTLRDRETGHGPEPSTRLFVSCSGSGTSDEADDYVDELGATGLGTRDDLR
ncbi:MAG: hypothetical protein AVDCRST_MAG25-3320 [uncultured Rubrobacteraceae bacterium]|uniref:Uncharacterized protein n=1 Tax=uncultured Rubrobacteraceae bacterium TaxID=349277 RepID=A0A6J4SF87_9ACTN|nr:MAG: hypothetical protein AVDCRST_MAG25-3320 [uncultured Rubrobacteraceae bacterium]